MAANCYIWINGQQSEMDLAATTDSIDAAAGLERKRDDSAAAPVGQGVDSAQTGEDTYESASRTTLWLIGGGFAMMFVASIMMWLRFGPSMFVDLATAIQSCL